VANTFSAHGLSIASEKACCMKVLLVTTSFPQNHSGAEAAGSFVADFAHELAGTAEIAIVAPGIQECLEVDARGLKIYRYKASNQPLSTLKPQNPFHWPAITATLISGNRATLKAAKELGADFILALWALPSGYWAQQAAKKLAIPYATWALGSDIWALGRLPLVRSLLARVMANASCRFADGYQLAKDVERISGKPCEFLPSARQLPVCGVPLEHKPPYRLVFLGRWHPNKGIDLLLDALLGLSDDDWRQIEMVRIAGGGPMAALVNEKIAQLHTQGRPVKLEGYKNVLEAAELLTWSDVVLITSRIESIPVVYSDALQATRLVIATPVGDFPRLSDEQPGKGKIVLCNTTMVSDIAVLLRKVLDSGGWSFQDASGYDLLSAGVRKLYDAASSV